MKGWGGRHYGTCVTMSSASAHILPAQHIHTQRIRAGCITGRGLDRSTYPGQAVQCGREVRGKTRLPLLPAASYPPSAPSQKLPCTRISACSLLTPYMQGSNGQGQDASLCVQYIYD